MSKTERLTRIDAGQPAVAVDAPSPDSDVTLSLDVCSTSTNGDVLFQVDTDGFATLSLHVTSVGSGGGITLECSDDGVTWVAAVPWVLASSPASALSVAALTAVGVYIAMLSARFVRARVTALTSGTVTVYPRLLQQPRITATPGTLNISGTVTIAQNLNATGASIHRVNSAASINATVVKASPGNVYALKLFNTSGSLRYLKLYNRAVTPVPASDTAVLVCTVIIPANSTVDVDFSSLGARFTAGISYTIVAGLADTDATAVGAQDVTGALTWS